MTDSGKVIGRIGGNYQPPEREISVGEALSMADAWYHRRFTNNYTDAVAGEMRGHLLTRAMDIKPRHRGCTAIYLVAIDGFTVESQIHQAKSFLSSEYAELAAVTKALGRQDEPWHATDKGHELTIDCGRMMTFIRGIGEAQKKLQLGPGADADTEYVEAGFLGAFKNWQGYSDFLKRLANNNRYIDGLTGQERSDDASVRLAEDQMIGFIVEKLDYVVEKVFGDLISTEPFTV